MTINEYQRMALRTESNLDEQMNVEKLKSRYPDGFDAEHSIHRREDDV